MWYASNTGQVRMVKLLIQAGADATLLPKPDEPPKPVVIQGFATLLPKPDEPPKPIDEPPKTW